MFLDFNFIVLALMAMGMLYLVLTYNAKQAKLYRQRCLEKGLNPLSM